MLILSVEAETYLELVDKALKELGLRDAPLTRFMMLQCHHKVEIPKALKCITCTL